MILLSPPVTNNESGEYGLTKEQLYDLCHMRVIPPADD